MRPSPVIPASSNPRGARVLLAMLLASLAAIAAAGGVEGRDGRVASGRLQTLGLVTGWIEVDGVDGATGSPRTLVAGRDLGRPAAAPTPMLKGGFGGSSLAGILAIVANTPPPAC